MRVAALDCGTNSVRLLIADVSDDGRLRDVRREMRIVRLGQDVDRTGMLAPEALARTADALDAYRAEIRDTGAERVRLVATSATRDARNRDEFVALVRGRLGVDPEIATGWEEAALSFTGAASVRTEPGPLLVIDIGGGSTELVRGEQDAAGRQVGDLRAHSMDVGSVRLTERHVRSDPPARAEIAAVERDVRSALDAARDDVPLDGGTALVGVAGTVTTVAALALGLDEYRSELVHGARLTRAEVDEVTERLLGMDHAARARQPVIHPGRVDVIAAGAVVLRTLVHEIGAAGLVASEHDILDGIALGLAG